MLLITDTHLKQSNLSLIKEIFDNCIDICKKNNFKIIFHAGDFFTSRVGQSQEVLLLSDEIFENLKKNDIELYIIAGNHDKTNLNSKESYLDLFKNKINVIDSFKEVYKDDYKVIFMLPYFLEKNYSNFIEKVKDEYKNLTKILITHIAVKDSKNNDNIKVSDFVSGEIFKDFDFVYIGHFHDRQKINDKIFYIGSSHQSNFGEDENKGVCFIKQNGTLKYINKQYTKFNKIEVDISDIDKDFIENLKNIENVKLVVNGNKEVLKENDLLSKIKDLKNVKLEIKNVYELNDNDNVSKLSFEKKEIFEHFKIFTTKNILDYNKGLKYFEGGNKTI